MIKQIINEYGEPAPMPPMMPRVPMNQYPMGMVPGIGDQISDHLKRNWWKYLLGAGMVAYPGIKKKAELNKAQNILDTSNAQRAAMRELYDPNNSKLNTDQHAKDLLKAHGQEWTPDPNIGSPDEQSKALHAKAQGLLQQADDAHLGYQKDVAKAAQKVKNSIFGHIPIIGTPNDDQLTGYGLNTAQLNTINSHPYTWNGQNQAYGINGTGINPNFNADIHNNIMQDRANTEFTNQLNQHLATLQNTNASQEELNKAIDGLKTHLNDNPGLIEKLGLTKQVNDALNSQQQNNQQLQPSGYDKNKSILDNYSSFVNQKDEDGNFIHRYGGTSHVMQHDQTKDFILSNIDQFKIKDKDGKLQPLTPASLESLLNKYKTDSEHDPNTKEITKHGTFDHDGFWKEFNSYNQHLIPNSSNNASNAGQSNVGTSLPNQTQNDIIAFVGNHSKYKPSDKQLHPDIISDIQKKFGSDGVKFAIDQFNESNINNIIFNDLNLTENEDQDMTREINHWKNKIPDDGDHNTDHWHVAKKILKGVGLAAGAVALGGGAAHLVGNAHEKNAEAFHQMGDTAAARSSQAKANVARSLDPIHHVKNMYGALTDRFSGEKE